MRWIGIIEYLKIGEINWNLQRNVKSRIIAVKEMYIKYTSFNILSSNSYINQWYDIFNK